MNISILAMNISILTGKAEFSRGLWRAPAPCPKYASVPNTQVYQIRKCINYQLVSTYIHDVYAFLTSFSGILSFHFMCACLSSLLHIHLSDLYNKAKSWHLIGLNFKSTVFIDKCRILINIEYMLIQVSYQK